MLKNLASFSAAGAAALALSACGGGGGGTAPSTQTVDFQWASLSQVIPAGQTSLTITPASCEDWTTPAHAAMTGVTIDISANGDVVLKKDGVEQMQVPFSARYLASLDIVGTPGSVDAYVKASGRAIDQVVVQAQAQAIQPKVSGGRATYELTQTTFGMDSTRAGMNVQCTLSAPLKHNGALTMDNLRAGFVPTGEGKDLSLRAFGNNTVLDYGMTEFSASVVHNNNWTLASLPLTDNAVQKLSQNYYQSSQFLGGKTFTHFLTIDLVLDNGGTSVSDKYTIGYDSTEGSSTSLKMTGYQATQNL